MKTLERSLGLVGVVSISIGAMIGGGLFVLPGMAGALTGSSVWLAYLVAGLCIFPAALSKSELATAMPTSGGTYVYLERTFGPLTGTVAGIGLWLALLLKSAFALVGFSAYLSILAPDLPIQMTGLVLLGGIVTMNILGIKAVSTITKIIVTTVITGLVILSVFALGDTFEPTNLQDMFPKGSAGFITAVAFVYLSYAGVTKVAAIAEEVKNPGRNLPLGILLSLGIVTAIYSMVVFVMMANVPEVMEVNSTTGEPNLVPIYTLAQKVGGENIALAVAVLSIVTMTSMALAGLLASSRFPFAMSRDSLVPPAFQKISPRFMTPIHSIVITGIVIGLTIICFDVVQIAKLTSAFQIIVFAAENLTVIVLRETHPQWYKPPFRSPFYPWIQIVGIVIGLVLLVVIGWSGLLALITIIIAGVVFYLAYGHKRTQRLGEVGKRGQRRELLSAQTQSHDLNEVLPGEASVVVPLFGHERSPEILVEMGAVLADGRKLEVLDVTEVPEQTILDAVLEEDVYTTSLRRRLLAMAEEEKLDLEFTTTVSRDVVHTIHHVASRLHSDWVAMEWRGRRRTSLTIHNPIGWLQDHLPCNLALFKDTGVRYVRKILVVAEPGPHDALVVTTADHMASLYNAELYFAQYSPGETSNKYLQQMRALCKAPTHIHTLQGESKFGALSKCTAEHDLMVLAAPANRHFWGLSLETMEDRLIARSACDVLALKTGLGSTHDSMNDPDDHESIKGSLLVSATDPKSCALHVSISKQDDLFGFLADLFARSIPELDAEQMKKALLEREQQQSTSLGMGLAVPHAAVPMEGGARVAIITLDKPIDYRAPDKQKVDVVFGILGSPKDRQEHLTLLSEISKLSMNTSFLPELRRVDTVEEIMVLLRKHTASANAPTPG